MVKMLLTGSYQRSVDEKHRIAIPKRLRDSMGHPEVSVVYVAPGMDGSLALYTEEAFSEVAEKLSNSSPNGEDVRAFSRLFYAQAQQAELDGQGRIRVPSELVELVGLGKEAMLLGVRDHIELWDAERWLAYKKKKQTHYDEIAEKAFGQSS
jgi:MraZ protein